MQVWLGTTLGALPILLGLSCFAQGPGVTRAHKAFDAKLLSSFVCPSCCGTCMSYVIDPPAQSSLPIVGQEARFPVGRIFCVGRNYEDHVREMGGDPARGTPIFFAKPASALVQSGAVLDYPMATSDLHHEIELAVALSKGGSNVSINDAPSLIFGYGVALDMTRRDLQGEAKKGGKPWDMAKGFDQSAPCGALTATPGQALDAGAISLQVNGQPRQTGDIARMIWSLAEIIAALSSLVTLQPGDLILSGTPAGVGPVDRGDQLDGSIDGLAPLSVRYAP